MKRTGITAAIACAAMALSGVAHAGIVTEAFQADAWAYSDGNRLYDSTGGYSGAVGAVQLLVQYDADQLAGCTNSATSSWCTAPTTGNAMSALFTTTTYNHGTQTFTVTGGGAALPGGPSCPEGFCSDTGGGVHIYEDNGLTDIQFYTFGTDGRYMANLLHTNLSWVNGETATDAAFVNAAIADYSYTNWFYSGAWSPNPYDNGPNFAPGNYYAIGGLSPLTSATPEPGGMLLLGSALGGLLAALRRRRVSSNGRG